VHCWSGNRAADVGKGARSYDAACARCPCPEKRVMGCDVACGERPNRSRCRGCHARGLNEVDSPLVGGVGAESGHRDGRNSGLLVVVSGSVRGSGL
jgi:hypothetical protein